MIAVLVALLGPVHREATPPPAAAGPAVGATALDSAPVDSAPPLNSAPPLDSAPIGNAPIGNAAVALEAPAETPAPTPPAGPGGRPDTGKPGAGAKRPLTVPVALPGLPPYLPVLLSAVPGPPKPAPAKPAPAKKPPVVAPKKPVIPGLSGPAAAVVALTNAERAKAGCKPLQVDSRLNKSALGHSADMSNRDYFEHESPEGEDFADREAEAGFKGNSGGENIARGQRSAAEVMDDWMHSPGHKRNILDCKFTKIGVGYDPDGHYWTQNFGG